MRVKIVEAAHLVIQNSLEKQVFLFNFSELLLKEHNTGFSLRFQRTRSKDDTVSEKRAVPFKNVLL